MSDFDTVRQAIQWASKAEDEYDDGSQVETNAARAALDRIEAMMQARTIEKPFYQELTCDDHRGKDYSEETLLCQWCYREQAEAELTRLRNLVQDLVPWVAAALVPNGHEERHRSLLVQMQDALTTQENNDD